MLELLIDWGFPEREYPNSWRVSENYRDLGVQPLLEEIESAAEIPRLDFPASQSQQLLA